MKGVIVGFGNMGQTHLSRYKDLSIDVQGVIELDGAKCAMAHKSGLQTYERLAQMDLRSVDFIDICTPTHLHYEHLTEAMSYQKAIFIEKPVVRTRGEACALRSVSYPLPIFVGEVEQYNPRLAQFLNYKERPQKIEISRKVNLGFFLKGTTPWFLDESLSGGIVLDLMIHDINLLIGKYGRPSVKSAVSRSKKYDVIDEVEVILEFADFEATLKATWTAERTDTPIVAEIKYLDAEQGEVAIRCDDYLIRQDSAERDAFHVELKAFIEAVKSGVAPNPLSIYLDGVEVAEDIKEWMK